MSTNFYLLILVLLLNNSFNQIVANDNDVEGKKSFEEEQYGVRYADDCEGI